MHPSRPHFARYRLRGARVPISATVALAEGLRAALLAQFPGDAPRVFTGRSRDGDPAEAGHRHAFYLPADTDRDGLLDHVDVWAPCGFGRAARGALRDLRWLSVRGVPPLELDLVGLGSWREIGAEEHRPTRSWTSLTPFVPTRHPKVRNGRPVLDAEGRWRDGPVEQLLRELTLRGLPAPEALELRPAPAAWRRLELRRRRGDGRAFGDRGYAFTLRFSEPQPGPLALGYGCHFGLGRLVALQESRASAAQPGGLAPLSGEPPLEDQEPS